MPSQRLILHIAVPSPLMRLFDYLPPAGVAAAELQPGQRLRVPFGRSRCIGILVATSDNSELGDDRLKPAEALLDHEPCLPADILELVLWAADYYHHAPGDALHSALPALLRQGKPAEVKGRRVWTLTPDGKTATAEVLRRAPRQAALLARLQRPPHEIDDDALRALREAQGGDWRGALRGLQGKGLVSGRQAPCLPPGAETPRPAPELNADQEAAVQAVRSALGGFQAFLLDGVTGSGKTEVYLRVIAEVIEQGRQVLVLVPEIGLTPQLLRRFQRRFRQPVAALHSGLGERARLCAWQMAKQGEAAIVIGTRSAVFTPLARPGLVIVDEEHDPSLKQQDGFRYHARDLAVWRARHAGVPVILGSATPALESLHNAARGRYRCLRLQQRAGAAKPPGLRLHDLRHQPLRAGLAPALIDAMQRHLAAGNQVLIFLNRRGYSPTLLCHDCGWLAECPRCDSHLTLHRAERALRCHHCDSQRPLPRYCPACGSSDLRALGQGTERIEEELAQLFPAAGIVRIDRDSTRRKGAMQDKLARARSGEAGILVGTQMLAKGHHFPHLTLAVILDADQGLYSTDFRAAERLAQLIVQVAGRAGRGEREGEVAIQTHAPDHPLLRRLLEQGYAAFAQAALAEREQAGLPPFSRLALLRAEAASRDTVETFLRAAFEAARGTVAEGLQLFGPLPAPRPRRAGRHRGQLLIQAPERRALHAFLDAWLPAVAASKTARRVRWSIDIDPMDMA